MMNNHIYGSKVPQNPPFWGPEYAFQAKYAKNSNSYIFRSVYQIDMKIDSAAASNRDFVGGLVLYGGKTIPRWRMAAILKIDISPYLSEKSSDFDEILYTAADFELDEHHVIKNEKSCIAQTPEFDRTYFL